MGLIHEMNELTLSLLWIQCKLLWIKASGKYINVAILKCFVLILLMQTELKKQTNKQINYK